MFANASFGGFFLCILTGILYLIQTRRWQRAGTRYVHMSIQTYLRIHYAHSNGIYDRVCRIVWHGAIYAVKLQGLLFHSQEHHTYSVIVWTIFLKHHRVRVATAARFIRMLEIHVDDIRHPTQHIFSKQMRENVRHTYM